MYYTLSARSRGHRYKMCPLSVRSFPTPAALAPVWNDQKTYTDTGCVIKVPHAYRCTYIRIDQERAPHRASVPALLPSHPASRPRISSFATLSRTYLTVNMVNGTWSLIVPSLISALATREVSSIITFRSAAPHRHRSRPLAPQDLSLVASYHTEDVKHTQSLAAETFCCYSAPSYPDYRKYYSFSASLLVQLQQ